MCIRWFFNIVEQNARCDNKNNRDFLLEHSRIIHRILSVYLVHHHSKHAASEEYVAWFIQKEILSVWYFMLLSVLSKLLMDY
jgi:hypothetical protein